MRNLNHSDLDCGVGLAVVLASALLAAKKPRIRTISAAEQIVIDRRNERIRWNDEVEARKANKKLNT